MSLQKNYLSVEKYKLIPALTINEKWSLLSPLLNILLLILLSFSLSLSSTLRETVSHALLINITTYDNILLFIRLCLLLYLLLFLPYFFPKKIEILLKVLKQLIIKKLLLREEIYFYKPTEHNNYYFNVINPHNITFYTDEKNLSTSENNYIFLNAIPYTDSKILNPYCHIILCSTIFTPLNIWLYFLILFFTINLLYSAIIFLGLYNIHYFILLEKISRIFFLALFIIYLTYFFGRIIWIVIKNIHLSECKKESILRHLSTLSRENQTLDNNKLNEYFLILFNNKTVNINDMFHTDMEKTDDLLTDKITSIIQISAPLFYLAYVTITVSILIKFTP